MLRAHSVPAAILRILLAGRARIAYDARLLGEYREVSERPKFGFDPSLARQVIDGLVAEGLEVVAVPLPRSLPDPDDDPFLEVALAAGPNVPLITGNLKHYPEPYRAGVTVLSPSVWLERWRGSGSDPIGEVTR